MNQDLLFDGKSFISVSRASRETGYTQDYLGQLCRAEKINARMVGRTWYVDHQAILAHKENPSSRKKKNVRENDLVGSRLICKPHRGSTGDYKSPFVYKGDYTPLLPTLNKRSTSNFGVVAETKRSLDLAPYVIVVLFLVAVFSWMNLLTPRATEIAVANIKDILAISASEGQMLYSGLAFNFDGMRLTGSATGANSTSLVQLGDGLLAFPETSNHEKSVATVQSTFSDETDIQFDKSGDSGVITPVFNKGNPGQGYTFVMVPVKEHTQ